MLKIALLLMKNVCFGLKKGISEFFHQVAPKHTADVAFLRKDCSIPLAFWYFQSM